MKKLAAVLSLVMTAGMMAPAFAADDDHLNQAVQGSLMVTRVGGVGAGMVLGTPVAVLRQTCKSYVHLTEKVADKLPGGHESGPSCAVASLFTVPAALVVGPATGTYYGVKNGLDDGFNHPFSPASFSLDEKYAGD